MRMRVRGPVWASNQQVQWSPTRKKARFCGARTNIPARDNTHWYDAYKLVVQLFRYFSTFLVLYFRNKLPDKT